VFWSFSLLSLIMCARAFSSIANTRMNVALFLAPSHLKQRVISCALHLSPSDSSMESSGKSVTGSIYDTENKADFPVVQLYTKEGCTLCDKVSDVLRSLREEQPHSLEAIDITDSDKTDSWDRYKWDIPVLHIDGKYWTKHKLEAGEAVEALTKAKNGEFEEQSGEPDAAAMERRMNERKTQS